jgi:DNA-binding CsgD family transcriptional regulator
LSERLTLLMDELAHGIVIVSIEGRILHANRVARSELALRQRLAAHGPRLQAIEPSDRRALHMALAFAADGKRSLVSLAGARQGPALTITVMPLRSESLHRTSTAALLFARSSVCNALMLGFFARANGLTPAEEQVLGLLCQGYSAPETAQQLKVAVSTVRSHVRSLCAKTGTCGMRELVNRVAVLPPITPQHEAMH